MLKLASKDAARRRIHKRIRERMIPSSRLPRLNVFRSTANVYAQIIDDAGCHTLVSASSRDREVRQTLRTGGNVAAAKVVGKVLAERAKAAGISQVAFDRGGYAYHGRVKALADAAREGGLQF
jgi:large subunit ribosomal protein L18